MVVARVNAPAHPHTFNDRIGRPSAGLGRYFWKPTFVAAER